MSQEQVSISKAETVAEAVRAGRAQDLPDAKIARMVADRFGDVPQERIRRIVETTPDQQSVSAEEIKLTQPQETEAQPRPSVGRAFGVDDFQFLSPREAGRVIGLALERFEGNTVRPTETDEVECDLYWNRTHTTVGLRLVPTPDWEVDAEAPIALVQGSTIAQATRPPSKLVLVTNGALTDEASTYAEEHEIQCIDGGRLDSLLRRARLPRDAVGTVLEDGEDHDGPLSELVDVPAVPEPQSCDPLGVRASVDVAALRNDTESRDRSPDVSQSASGLSGERQRSNGAFGQPAGEKGTLYADPNQDGDYEAFDRFVDETKGSLDSETNSGTATAAGDQDNSESDPDRVDREELILELLNAKNSLEPPRSGDDIIEQTPYSEAQYQSEFGSVSDALGAIGFEYQVSE